MITKKSKWGSNRWKYCYFLLRKNEETEETEECLELNINSETSFSEAKAAFELVTNFARSKIRWW